MSTCKRCGAQIVFVKMKSGKTMPCDLPAVVYWQDPHGNKTIITAYGETVRANLKGLPGLGTGVGYTSHFATCPDADCFRSRKEAKA